MKTLYFRIVATILLVIAFSGFMGFILSNYYYHFHLKSHNDQKISQMVQETANYMEKENVKNPNLYLQNISKLGYQFLLVNPANEGKFYGADFRVKTLDAKIIQSVKNGQTYHGIAQFPASLFMTGFFDNVIKNTVGVPVKINHENYALFMRPNTEIQFGELRFYFSMVVLFTLVFSSLLILVSTRYIVKPIVKLTDATKKISEGNFKVDLQVKRKDEIGILSQHFSSMTKGLKQLEDMRQQFVSNVSHEIQSPLSSIQGFAQTLQQEDLTEDERKHYLSIIENESKRLSQLSKQLLLLSSLENESSVLEKTSYHLATQMKEIIFMTEWGWRKKKLSIEMDMSPAMVYGDQRLLYQVWLNLMTNCIKYSKDGGLICMSILQKNDGLHIRFKDTGIGMQEEEIAHIFDRFYKVDTARTREESNASSGLGLSIVKKIIQMHNGEITVKSQVGVGTTFSIKLPKL